MRETRKYSEQFKQRAVQKLLSSPYSVKLIAEEIGIPHATLYSWRAKCAKSSSMKNKISAEEKLQILIETSSLSENNLGEYLRRKGLHSSDLEQWKTECYSGMQQTGRPKLDPEVVILRKDKKDLSKELHRKDKALAEVSARVILLKKSHEIFGVGEDDE